MLEPIVDLCASIIEQTSKTAKRYSQVWHGQTTASTDYFNFNSVRERYNNEKDPVDLLYLVCRCVKNAVRFNGGGRFTQSHDKRRLEMAPDKMALAIEGV
ncbi:DNA adenine methylase [Xylella fastidiosa subsp. multiplex]|uniref:DNA adenine methylase n=1 Tax=Xylella fastidiosa TaxID=2371 RepID=UPI0023622081|nr:DNA adenine methylase [Xylella fastidiosa]MDD0927185.1 DNA adenine methylase [Xylella fastidiosa subsp. multiplex]